MESNKVPAQSPQDKAYVRKQMIKFFIFLAVTVGIALWMMLDNIWPASKFIEWQLGWFRGEYYPKLTFAIIWMLILLGGVMVYSLFDGIWGMIKRKK